MSRDWHRLAVASYYRIVVGVTEALQGAILARRSS
jgi:hypothetical protein